MIILDTLLIGGLRFVLDKLASAVDAEMNDDTALRERLIAAQMQLELGELTAEEFATLEAGILGRLREIRSQRQGADAASLASSDYRVAGVDASFTGDEHT